MAAPGLTAGDRTAAWGWFGKLGRVERGVVMALSRGGAPFLSVEKIRVLEVGTGAG
jgi:hypothetical protein